MVRAFRNRWLLALVVLTMGLGAGLFAAHFAAPDHGPDCALCQIANTSPGLPSGPAPELHDITCQRVVVDAPVELPVSEVGLPTRSRAPPTS